MKTLLLRIEHHLLAIFPARWAVSGLSFLVKRLLWLWGRIRFGVLVRDKGVNCVCAWDCDLKYPENISLGSRVIIGTNVSLGAHSTIKIDDNARLSRDVIIETAGLDFSTSTPPYRHISEPIHIGKGVWIGARAMILGGVHIGEGAVVAAGAIVTRSVPAGDIVAGTPARSVKKL